ncbi:MAG: hypothetical protein A2600_04365 [Candidatus Lambdaproteobacteria bacterium RIFOXYD1_FULL_56_27]|uniref:Fe/B12 periplasmic-binding domain-containing protein n=1 Tax=Candidatus Lambdaproteobacteria bacterium RIFOXYD2_FULL_56_26 TaxID=1817773 RepID=A0A1F6H3P0_9PROT|nr:MAG: hypothetical protein A2557_08430 [Candidatus Lambdaproteobacteria bacterium RIFOXYD2_FULL_56_26]OGH09454.1 MAG: hypothetical protein A2600_04365 [Candidatus Lambdaproteobacteria bacterium RIFOXYD1_FULL_56_27]
MRIPLVLGLLFWGGLGLGAEVCPTPKVTQPRWAQGFAFEAGPGYKLVRVKTPWQDSEEVFSYLILSPGCPKPAAYSTTPTFAPNPQRLVALSTTDLPILVILGLEDRLVATTDFAYVNSPEVRARIEAGKLEEVHYELEGELEHLVMLKPDLVLGFALSDKSARPKEALGRLGVQLVLTAGYMEESPLGRAEWILMVAAFFGLEEKAVAHMDQVSGDYLAWAAKANQTPTRPQVFVGSEFKGIWYVPGGRTYQSQLLKDAGARYLWAEDPQRGSLHLDFEALLAQASEVPFWLNPGNWTNLKPIESQPAFQGFLAVRTGQVYSYTKKLNPKGGNDYWETGSVYPNRVLKDLISLFHPELLPGYQTLWYKRLQ